MITPFHDYTADHRYSSPAHPFTGKDVIARIRNLIANEHGYRMTFARIARIIGRPTSTTGYWLSIHNNPHILAFICLLERLSEADRHRFIAGVCRTLPTLTHPCLTHSPQIMRILLEIVSKPRGITLIKGNSESVRSFVIHAIGHTFPQIDHQHRLPIGIDVHPPEKFVPVDGVIYLQSNRPRGYKTIPLETAWAELRNSTAPLLLLNGVWSVAPEKHDQIVEWAGQRHVVLADTIGHDLRLLSRLGRCPLHILDVSQSPECRKIQVDCEEY